MDMLIVILTCMCSGLEIFEGFEFFIHICLFLETMLLLIVNVTAEKRNKAHCLDTNIYIYIYIYIYIILYCNLSSLPVNIKLFVP